MSRFHARFAFRAFRALCPNPLEPLLRIPCEAAASALWVATATAATACFVALTLQPAHAQAQTQDVGAPRLKTESPYFFVQGSDTGVDALPLKSTTVDVRIAGVIADVTVTQHYRNDGQQPIEAQYVFPGSTRAAVYGMNVRLADRLITASIREKQQARVDYDAAKMQGKTAALLEQHVPNVFQMKVANILPGDDVKVELRYTELLLPQSGNYQFVFPTVVGPRYNSGQPPKDAQTAPASTQWVAQPYLAAGQRPVSAFDLKVQIATPIALKEVRSPSHTVAVTQDGEQQAGVSLRQPGASEGNRDFILDYRLAGDRIESGVMLYKGPSDASGTPGENFFLAMVQPPKHVTAQTINPRDYIFVVDISGSMQGFPLETSKAVLRDLIGKLRPTDTFNVLLFSGSNRWLSPNSVPATQANIAQALRTLDISTGGGSTELIPALKRVYAEPKAANVSRTIVVVTDGYVTVEREAFELVRRNLSQANLFAFGIGSSVNRHLIEGLARAGMGEPFIITKPAEAAAQAESFRKMIESPVLTSVTARFEGMDVYDIEPAQLPDVLTERPVIVFGKWRGPVGGQLVVEGQSASGAYRQAVAIHERGSQSSAALRYLWARHRIAALSDQESLEGGESYRQPITDLGLKYALLTSYTSFLAIDQVVRNPNAANSPSVNQPLLLPEGVGNLAIGAEVPGTPEAGTWISMALLLAVLAMLARRHRRQQRGNGLGATRFTA